MMSKPIYVFGDSAAQGVYLDDEGSYRVSRQGCIRLLKKAGYPMMNYAAHGYTIVEGLEAFHQIEMEPGASCVIEFGGNDCDLDWDAVSEDPAHFHDGKVPLLQFEERLAYFIRAARARETEPILVTPLPLMSSRYYAWVCRGRKAENILRYLFDDPEAISRWQERYANAIRNTANRYQCRLADLRGWMLEEPNYPSLICMDGIHPNETGHARIARAAAASFPIC